MVSGVCVKGLGLIDLVSLNSMLDSNKEEEEEKVEG